MNYPTRNTAIRLCYATLALTSILQSLFSQLSPEPPADAQQLPLEVNRIYAADHDLLVLEIIEGQIERNGQILYEPAEGDVFEDSEEQVLAWVDGEPKWTAKNHVLKRRVDGILKNIGHYLKSAEKIALFEIHHPTPMNSGALDQAANYTIQSQASGSFQPQTVFRKSKPIDELQYGGGQAIRHRIYLQLPETVQSGAQYSISIKNVWEENVELVFTHQPETQWSEAIHVNQVGYHPGDAFKKGTLSLWKGTGGAHDYDHLEESEFSLVDTETGLSVYSGVIRKIQDETTIDAAFINEKNNSQTSTYALDFSGFHDSGTYRILIPEIGVSYPFPIAEDTWLKAFSTSMMGILHHRSGIELGPPFTDYIRPLNFHPSMGLNAMQIDRTTVSGESDAVREAFERLGTDLPSVPEAWGGYMDAGDWDRRSVHLDTTYLHLELFELYPEYFTSVQLSLPPEEVENDIPDLLDEALWNIEFYQRLMTPDGGVRGGIESTGHPRSGEASWQETQLVGVFAPDAVSSYRFASNAAKASRLISQIHPQKALDLRLDAIRAWNWAQENLQATLNSVPENKQDDTRNAISKSRATAAVELLWLTEDPGFQIVFAAEVSQLSTQNAIREKHRNSIFTYARMPEHLVDAQLQQSCKKAVTDLADLALEFQQNNPYSIASDNEYLPMMGYLCYFSVPGLISNSLPRAHFLTGDTRYLKATVAACNFPNGANPDNLVYTTGLGSHFPTSPLHIDSRVSGQPAPKGITIYGPSDPAEDFSFNEWVHRWRLGSMVPNSRTWPAAESHVNLFGWPSMSEYTVHQTMGPTAYYWGYIAGYHHFLPDPEEEAPGVTNE